MLQAAHEVSGVEATHSVSDPVILVVAALPEELAPLVRRASGVFATRLGPVRTFRGGLGGTPLVMASTGVGPLKAERGVRALLDAFDVRVLFGIGVSGGLSPGLQTGTILAGRDVWDSSSKMPGPDPRWLEAVLGYGGGIRAGALVSVPRLVSTQEQKAALLASLPCTDPAVVDMESSAWVKVASLRNVPYLILRSVFDPPDEDLPGFLARCQDPDGGLGRARVVREALIRPHLLPSLFAMERRVRRCASDLADCVQNLLESEASMRPGRPGGDR
jgi:adenosylhomocysteine nucleosidase